MLVHTVTCVCTTCSGLQIDGFKLTFGGQTTSLLLADASVANVVSALEVLPFERSSMLLGYEIYEILLYFASNFV